MHIYEVLKRPVVTEKTMIATDESNKVAFEVDMRAEQAPGQSRPWRKRSM